MKTRRRSSSIRQSRDDMERAPPRGVCDDSDDDDNDNDVDHHDHHRRSKLGAKETVTVQRSKSLVHMALTLTGVIVGVTTYIFVRRDETNTFRTEFYGFADEIINSVEINVKAQVAGIQSVTTACTSHALSSHSTWPNVTVPHFGRRGQVTFQNAKQQQWSSDLDKGGASNEYLALFPLILPTSSSNNNTETTHMNAFVEYANEHVQEWRWDGLQAEGRWQELAQEQLQQQQQQPLQVQSLTDDRLRAPLWQITPVPANYTALLQDFYALDWFRDLADYAVAYQRPIVSGFNSYFQRKLYGPAIYAATVGNDSSVLVSPIWDQFPDSWEYREYVQQQQQHDDNASPVPLATTQPGIVGLLSAVLEWETYLQGLLPPLLPPLLVEIKDGCGQAFSYRVQGLEGVKVGPGTWHDDRYNGLHRETNLADFLSFQGNDTEARRQYCYYRIDIYPSQELEDQYRSAQPILISICMFSVFFFTMVVFGLYDHSVARRQDLVVSVAERSNHIVSSLFPANVQERIMQEAHRQEKNRLVPRSGSRRDLYSTNPDSSAGGDSGRQSSNNHPGAPHLQSAPIADFFPHTTIMFADLAGFTAWSSMQQPAQVFTLLETIYYEFDQIAKRRRIFKVETVGDCYVAVAGLPDPRPDHAVAMARFARDCLQRMNLLMGQLEERMGPETAELGLRTGLHSGSVTAGVLRGEKARFQLFGDTMNTTSRIETTGQKHKIHLSQQTAELLMQANKGHWITLRQDKVVAKGKGELTTYWLLTQDEPSAPSSSREAESERPLIESLDDDVVITENKPQQHEEHPQNAVERRLSMGVGDPRRKRFVKWSTEVLARQLEVVLHHRRACAVQADSVESMQNLERAQAATMVGDRQDISLSPFDVRAWSTHDPSSASTMSATAHDQLDAFVLAISNLYQDHAFHNLEHAGHVLMSVGKLVSRMVEPDKHPSPSSSSGNVLLTSDVDTIQSLHKRTFGIASDALAQFSVMFAALIHDIDHAGVPNSVLVQEETPLARCYHNQSVAERNSLDIAWDLLLGDEYVDLRRVIYTNADEFHRFRQVLGQTVLATDLMDGNLARDRERCWDQAFGSNSNSNINDNTKAILVLEHLIQASDVAHTMQHWYVYRRWNARLFREMSAAHMAGRSTHGNPADYWYQGEIDFFDNCVIPLATKLQDCGVFGKFGDEYRTYALTNRAQWKQQGQSLVARMVEGEESENNGA